MPDGNVDAVIAAAWRDSPTEDAMIALVCWNRHGNWLPIPIAVLKAASGTPLHSRVAADAIRAAVPPPTFADLIRE